MASTYTLISTRFPDGTVVAANARRDFSDPPVLATVRLLA